MSSTTRVLHTTTWDYFSFRLPFHFGRSPKVMKEAIMTDINDLVQEFWRTSSDGAVGASFFAMHRLYNILKECFQFNRSEAPVCFDIISVFATVNFADKNLQISFDGYRKMMDQTFFKSKYLADMLIFLRILPGVVVQKHMSIRGMAHLYRIKPNLMERLIGSTLELLRPSNHYPSDYILDDYLFSFLQNRGRSQFFYCDPMLQHISICRHFLSLLHPGSNAFDLQS